MPLHFRTLRSGSSGNAALLWSNQSSILIDFAPGSQRACREILSDIRKYAPPVEAVVVTHAHGDHINHNSMRVLAGARIPIACHQHVARQIVLRHGNKHNTEIHGFEGLITVGEFSVETIKVDHAPSFYTTALAISHHGKRKKRKVSIFTDFCDYGFEHVGAAVDSDLMLLEANHDLKMLELYGHPGSEWHLPNPTAAQFLHDICHASKRQPSNVILGHLSESCNTPRLPEKEVRRHFAASDTPIHFALHTARRHEPGDTITLD